MFGLVGLQVPSPMTRLLVNPANMLDHAKCRHELIESPQQNVALHEHSTPQLHCPLRWRDQKPWLLRTIATWRHRFGHCFRRCLALHRSRFWRQTSRSRCLVSPCLVCHEGRGLGKQIIPIIGLVEVQNAVHAKAHNRTPRAAFRCKSIQNELRPGM